MIGLPPCQPTVAVVEALDDAVKVVGAEIVGADVRDGFTRVLMLPAVKVRLDDAVVDAVDEAVEIASRQPVHGDGRSRCRVGGRQVAGEAAAVGVAADERADAQTLLRRRAVTSSSMSMLKKAV